MSRERDITYVLAKINFSKTVLSWNKSIPQLMDLLFKKIKYDKKSYYSSGKYKWNFAGEKEIEINGRLLKYGKLFKRKITKDSIPILDENISDIVETEQQERKTPFSHFLIDKESENIVFEINHRIRLNTFINAFINLVTNNQSELGEITVIPRTYDNIEEIIQSFKRITSINISTVFPNGINNDNLDDLMSELNAERTQLNAQGKELNIRNNIVGNQLEKGNKGYTKYIIKGIDKEDNRKKVKSIDNAIQSQKKIEEDKDKVIHEFFEFLISNING